MPEPEEPEQRRKIFVGSLVFKTDEKDLKEFYSQFGEITDCVVMKVGQWQKNKAGYTGQDGAPGVIYFYTYP